MALRPHQLPVLDVFNQAALNYLEKQIDEELVSKFSIYDREIKLEIPVNSLESAAPSLNMLNIPAILTELLKKYLSKGWLGISVSYSQYFIYVKLINPHLQVPVIPAVVLDDNKLKEEKG